MSPQRIEKIGGQTLLDKRWANSPLNVIKNPHKLSEVELYQALEKIVEMPERRLKSMLKEGSQNSIDEVFLSNVMERIPQFLTATIVNITKSLLLQKDYFKDHPIWNSLEGELYRRRNNLNNEQLAQVIHAFGVTGHGTKEFYNELEETIIDSPINIETEHLIKIMVGYTEIDQGSSVFYNDCVERLVHRGIENLTMGQMMEVVKCLTKATNVHKAGFGFYNEVEKFIHNGLHQGKVTFSDLTQLVEVLLPNNIGSTEFQLELEHFLIEMYQVSNLQEITNLIKGLSQYQIKTEKLEMLIYTTIERKLDEFTLKQLETLIWSFSKSFKKNQGFQSLPEYKQYTLKLLIDKVKQKSPSMKARSVSFALESITNLNYRDEETYKRFEKVVLAKFDEFIPHYQVKILSSYFQSGFGSGELYDKLIQEILESIKKQTLNYSDMLRFFEIYPEVNYLYDSSMNDEIYRLFTTKIVTVIKDKKFPTEDACRVFNILVRISPYQPAKDNSNENKEHQRFLYDLIGKLRHSVFDIPKEYFTITMSNLIEYSQPQIAQKFIFIIQEIVKANKQLSDEFSTDQQIQLFWSLMQIEKSFKDNLIINKQNLQFMNKIDISQLKSRDFIIFKQLLCFILHYNKSVNFEQEEDELIDYAQIYDQISKLSQEKRQELINEDSATKTQPKVTQEIYKIVKDSKLFTQVQQNISDDLMNLIHVGMTNKGQLQGIVILNKHSYITSLDEQNRVLKRTVEVKIEQLEQIFGWKIFLVDEDEYLKAENKNEIILNILDLNQTEGKEKEEGEEQFQEVEKQGRRVKRCGIKKTQNA